jgi:hypothetical protein
MALLANRDYAKVSTVTLSRAAVEQFDARTKQWRITAERPSFQLPPAAAVLIRFATEK